MHTIHKPPAIGGDVGLGNDEIKVSEDLHHLQQYPWLVHAVNLSDITTSISLLNQELKLDACKLEFEKQKKKKKKPCITQQTQEMGFCPKWQ